MAEQAAVIGVGQTKFDARRIDVSQVGLIREAAERALEDAECDWKDIDAVVIGKAPDMFEGVMMPELFLAEVLGAVGKPMLRVHTAGDALTASRLMSGSCRCAYGFLRAFWRSLRATRIPVSSGACERWM